MNANDSDGGETRLTELVFVNDLGMNLPRPPVLGKATWFFKWWRFALHHFCHCLTLILWGSHAVMGTVAGMIPMWILMASSGQLYTRRMTTTAGVLNLKLAVPMSRQPLSRLGWKLKRWTWILDLSKTAGLTFWWWLHVFSYGWLLWGVKRGNDYNARNEEF